MIVALKALQKLSLLHSCLSDQTAVTSYMWAYIRLTDTARSKIHICDIDVHFLIRLFLHITKHIFFNSWNHVYWKLNLLDNIQTDLK